MTRQPPEPGADVYRIDPRHAHQDTDADPHPSRGYLEPPSYGPHFHGPHHAYACGATLATLRESCLDVIPVIDPEGNYTPSIELRFPDGAGIVTIHVEPET